MTSLYFQNNFVLGFGTYPLHGPVLAAAVSAALDAGYRAFDTAQMYGNEAEVGAALAQAVAAGQVRREELLITTKVHPDNVTPARFLSSVEESRRALGVAQIDVLLLHWPAIEGGVAGPVRLLDEARRQGLTQAIGISNFTARQMHEAREAVDSPIETNQVEFHALLDQSRLMAAAIETGIPLASYCSLARGAVPAEPLLAEIGARLGKSAGQVGLRWILQKGVSLNTMSTRPENIAANYAITDFSLSALDMAAIDSLNRRGLRIVSRDLVPWAPEWD